MQWIGKQLEPSTVSAHDHLGGFDSNYCNDFLNNVPAGSTVYTEYILSQEVKGRYPTLNLKFDAELMIAGNYLRQVAKISQQQMVEVNKNNITHFLCCFNRSAHISRQWAVSWIHHLNWFNEQYCSKHFSIQHHFCYVHPELKKQYMNHKFDQAFLDQIIKFDYAGPMEHKLHLQALSSKIQQCFVQLVTETVAESYCPFPTEKFLYPMLNKTLWVAYAQPGYHKFVETHMGFKQYQTFDYGFDNIRDPLDRLIALTDMLMPFSRLSQYDWHDIYLVEKDTIDYNLDLIQSAEFIKKIKQCNEKQIWFIIDTNG